MTGSPRAGTLWGTGDAVPAGPFVVTTPAGVPVVARRAGPVLKEAVVQSLTTIEDGMIEGVARRHPVVGRASAPDRAEGSWEPGCLPGPRPEVRS